MNSDEIDEVLEAAKPKNAVQPPPAAAPDISLSAETAPPVKKAAPADAAQAIKVSPHSSTDNAPKREVEKPSDINAPVAIVESDDDSMSAPPQLSPQGQSTSEVGVPSSTNAEPNDPHDVNSSSVECSITADILPNHNNYTVTDVTVGDRQVTFKEL